MQTRARRVLRELPAWLAAITVGALVITACTKDRFTGSDTDPVGTPENDAALCADGADNDGDGLTDCCDTDCSETQPCQPGGGPENVSNATCSDCIDNDGNGFTDCQDFACQEDPPISVCSALKEDNDAACSDNVDNDDDLYVDCEDFDCFCNEAVTVCPPNDNCPNNDDDTP